MDEVIHDWVNGWKEVCWRPSAAEGVRIARARCVRDHLAKNNPRRESKGKARAFSNQQALLNLL